MIIVTKCPLRISLAGGSTDLQGYLDKYESGNVISFTPELFTYIILKKSSSKQYKIVYSKVESALSSDKIKNDIARVVLSHFEMPPVEVVFTADIPSTGSGLASSSSYLIALIKACLEFQEREMSLQEIGELAINLERKFNPLTGYQDIYGCLYPGFKKLYFDRQGLNSLMRLPATIFNQYNFNLVPVGATRNSTNILSTLDFEEVHKMSSLTDKMTVALLKEDYKEVCDLIQAAWEMKKATSSSITTEEIESLEKIFDSDSHILSYRLIGAGSGGYFLVVTDRDYTLSLANLKINLYDV